MFCEMVDSRCCIYSEREGRIRRKIELGIPLQPQEKNNARIQEIVLAEGRTLNGVRMANILCIARAHVQGMVHVLSYRKVIERVPKEISSCSESSKAMRHAAG
ncbi:hypothetical protein TNCV_2020241 [Trichonephila clavipes]|nr:hypothetical protein TNCV_2020241 [Trichonephila clavipes]